MTADPGHHQAVPPDERPFCRACGYELTGLIDSSKCPECGRPIVEVLVRRSFPGARSRRYESRARMWGLPLVAIAQGPFGDEKYGKAVGVIAIGDVPTGVIAIGGAPLGVIAIGGLPRGIFALGGVCFGLVSCGGFSIGALALGGITLGLYTIGGLCFYVFKAIGGQGFKIWPW